MSSLRQRLWRSMRTVLVSPLRLFLNLWWPILGVCHSQTERKRVLLCPYDALMARYVGDVADLIKGDPRISISLTSPPKTFLRTPGPELAQELNVPHISYIMARSRWWDLIIFADYASVDRFHLDIKKILVNHFVGGGKILNNKEYRFERELSHKGKPLFTRIFEAGNAARDRAVAANPAMKDQIAVVGDLRSDKMLALRSQRDKIRRKLDFQDTETVVLIQSTWGPVSIMESRGTVLIEEAVRLIQKGKYRFIASTHPKHWYGRYSVDHPWGQYLLDHESKGLIVVQPTDDWAPFMVASDVVITDNTSLGATYSQLEKPMVFVTMPPGTIPEKSTVRQLYEISPHLDSAESLEQTLEEVMREYPIEKLHRISHQVNSYPGKAAERITEEVYNLLNLARKGDAFQATKCNRIEERDA